MPASEIDLMRFCHAEPCRGMEKPCRFGDFTYATNTRVLIEVPSGLWSGYAQENNPKYPKVAAVLEPFDKVAEWQQLPVPPDCPECKNIGLITASCSGCAGSTLCICNCGHEHDCGVCGGSGEEIDPCELCIIQFGNRQVTRVIFNLVAALPGVLWGVKNNKPDGILFFKFDGGRGAFMPIQAEKRPKVLK